MRSSPLSHPQLIQPCCWVEGEMFSLALVGYKMIQTELFIPQQQRWEVSSIHVLSSVGVLLLIFFTFHLFVKCHCDSWLAMFWHCSYQFFRCFPQSFEVSFPPLSASGFAYQSSKSKQSVLVLFPLLPMFSWSVIWWLLIPPLWSTS